LAENPVNLFSSIFAYLIFLGKSIRIQPVLSADINSFISC